MHNLIVHGDLAAITKAAQEDPDQVNQKNAAGLPPLYTAALYRNRQAMDWLRENGAEVDIFATGYLGNADQAEKLLQKDAELALAKTPDGKTALHYAAMAGHAAVCEALLGHQANVNARDEDGRTPLMEACHGGPWKPGPANDVIKLLLESGAEADLFVAAAMGRVDLIESLLDENPNRIDELNQDEETALFVAARNNQLETVELLVERGADVNKADALGIAALHRCSQQCRDELIRYLIDRGAKAHLCCYVACGDEAGTRKALAENPAAANENFYEYSAVGYAIHSWQLGTLRILLEHGCRLSAKDIGHIRRISGGDEELVRELLAIQNG